MRRLPATLALVLALAACDRLRVDSDGSSLLAVEPDLSVVLLDPTLTLRLVPTGLDGHLNVTVNTKPVAFDTSAGAFVVTKALVVGLNRFSLDVTDDEGTVRRDTLYAVHLPIRPISLASSQTVVPRVGAAAARLTNGQIAVTGGVGQDGQALASTTLLQVVSSRADTREEPLATARAGHTASVLPDGRALLLGGTLTSQPPSPSEFVRTAELLSADGVSLGTIPVDGGEVARFGHTAQTLTTGGVTYVYLYGGRVPAGTGTTFSGTVDIYRVDETPTTRLVRLTPAGGAGGFDPVAEHVQVPLQPRSAVVIGRGPDDAAVAFAFEWSVPGTASYPFELVRRPLPEVGATRTDAAAVDLGLTTTASGLALVIGGRDGNGDGPTGSIEVVAPEVGRSFRVPPEVGLSILRSGHTATILPGGRIVVTGGRNASGAALSTLEAFQF